MEKYKLVAKVVEKGKVVGFVALTESGKEELYSREKVENDAKAPAKSRLVENVVYAESIKNIRGLKDFKLSALPSVDKDGLVKTNFKAPRYSKNETVYTYFKNCIKSVKEYFKLNDKILKVSEYRPGSATYDSEGNPKNPNMFSYVLRDKTHKIIANQKNDFRVTKEQVDFEINALLNYLRNLKNRKAQ